MNNSLQYLILAIFAFFTFGCAYDDKPTTSHPVEDTPFAVWKCFYDFKIDGNADYVVIDFSAPEYGKRRIVSQTIYKDNVATELPLDVIITESTMQFYSYSNNTTVKYLARGLYMKLYLAEVGGDSDLTCVRKIN